MLNSTVNLTDTIDGLITAHAVLMLESLRLPLTKDKAQHLLDAIESDCGSVASERQSFTGEDFDGFLAITLNSVYFQHFTMGQLRFVRNFSRNMSMTNEIFKNVLFHKRNRLVGDGLTYTLLPIEDTPDPEKLVKAATTTQSPEITKMMQNWRKFSIANKFEAKVRDWATRVDRDGEVFLRLFKQPDVPKVRFIDPAFIYGNNTDYGIVYDPSDLEDIKAYIYTDPVTGNAKEIPADRIIHDKRNVDSETPRGLPSGYSVFTNMRRFEKLMTNVSIVAQIQSAIALIRKHENSTQARVNKFLDAKSAGKTKTSSVTGIAKRVAQYEGGTILDAPEGVTYDFPAHGIDPSKFIAMADKELSLIAANFVMPLNWLTSEEAVEPLNPGSPTISHMKTEQGVLYDSIEELFWRVQSDMGINVEEARNKFELFIQGPRLSVAKALDEARADDIYIRNGGTSPQEICARNGVNYNVIRSGMIKHRLTQQPGEVMPGDAGNTAGANTDNNQHDGLSRKGGGQRASDPAGGNNKT